MGSLLFGLLMSLGVPRASAAANLLTNGDFAAGLTGWTPQCNTWSTSGGGPITCGTSQFTTSSAGLDIVGVAGIPYASVTQTVASPANVVLTGTVTVNTMDECNTDGAVWVSVGLKDMDQKDLGSILFEHHPYTTGCTSYVSPSTSTLYAQDMPNWKAGQEPQTFTMDIGGIVAQHLGVLASQVAFVSVQLMVYTDLTAPDATFSSFSLTPAASAPSLTITTIGGMAVPASPTGSTTTPDVTLPSSTNATAVPVAVTAASVPDGATVQLYSLASTTLLGSGTLTAGTTTISVALPVGSAVALLAVVNSAAVNVTSAPVSMEISAGGLAFSPPSLDFGSQMTGTTSSGRTVIIINQGSSSITITAVTTQAPFAVDAAAGGLALPASGSPWTLAPGASQPVNVSFTPQSAGSAAGALLVSIAGAANPAEAPLAGAGVAPALPTLAITTIGGVAVPTGSATNPNVVLPATTDASAVAVAVAATNLPDGTPVQIDLGTSTTALGSGNLTGGKVTIDVALPVGSIVVLRAVVSGATTGVSTQSAPVSVEITPAAQTAAPISFASAATYGAGSQPVAAAIGRFFDGDTNLDLALADNTSPGAIAVLRGDGKGAFGAPVTTVAPQDFPNGLAAADFNSDGRTDLAVAAGFLSMMLGQGNGTFSDAQDYLDPSGQGAVAVAVADFNGDGKLDVAVADSANYRVLVLFGDGMGHVIAGGSYPVGTDPVAIAVADLNGDGKPDIVTADEAISSSSTSSTTGTVSVLLNKGDGTFQTAVKYDAGQDPNSVAIGDVNGDGKPDLVVTDGGGTEPIPLVMFPGKGDGTFGTPVMITAGQFPAAVAVADLNGDGHPDVAVADSGDGTASHPAAAVVLIADGQGSFQPPAVFPLGGQHPEAILVADLNHDGCPDLVTVNHGSNNVSVLLQAPALRIAGIDGAPVPTQPTGSTSTPDVTLPSGANASAVPIVVAGSCLPDGTSMHLFAGTTDLGSGMVTKGSVTITVSLPASGTSVLSAVAAGAGPGGANVTSAPVSVAFSAPPAPILQLSPAQGLQFGNQRAGATSTPMPLTLTNAGSATLSVTAATFAGANPGDFSVSPQQLSVAPGAEAVLNVTFKPAATGNRAATLQVTDNAADSPQSVPVSGTGVAPAVTLSLSSVTFGSQPVGLSGSPMVLTLANTGTDTLNISGITLGGANKSDFQFTAALTSPTTTTSGPVTFPVALGPLPAAIVISVTFKPSAVGSRAAILSIADDAAGSPQAITITGTGAQNLPPVTTAQIVQSTAGVNGWYTSPVQIQLTATDPEGASDIVSTTYMLDAGAAQPYTVPFTVSGDGKHQVSFFSTDAAANKESAQMLNVWIDATPPATTAAIAGPAGKNGWFTGPVTLNLSATDATSGVAKTEYSLDAGKTWTPGKQVPIAAEGSTSVLFRSTDVAGNRESDHSVAIKIDPTPPVTRVTLSESPLEEGWYATPLTLNFSATDVLVGVDHTEYSLDEGKTWTAGNQVALTSDRPDPPYHVMYRSVNNAGDVETARSVYTRLVTPSAPSSGPSGWTAMGSMLVARTGGTTATLLANGKVLAAGGFGDTGTSEVFDPSTNSYGSKVSIGPARALHSAELLPDDRALVVGGTGCGPSTCPLSSAELYYDAGINSWSLVNSGLAGAPPMTLGRAFFTATLLLDGRVLVTGGEGYGGTKASAEIYNPSTNTWSSAGSMSVPRNEQTATLLMDGRVLVAGGWRDFGQTNAQRNLASAEIYDPVTNTWTPTASMSVPRFQHTATLLPDGRVLVTGGGTVGTDGRIHAVNSAETYDPVSGTWSATDSMAVPRFGHTATLLPNGQVLVLGGAWQSSLAEPNAEIYHPDINRWAPAPMPWDVRGHQATLLLPGGQVLESGGGTIFNIGQAPGWALYTPGTCDPAGPSHLSASLPDPNSNSIALTWDDNSDNETGFEVQRRTSSDATFTSLGSVGPNVTAYTDTTAQLGTTYIYRVRAVLDLGNGTTCDSAFSNDAGITDPPNPIAAPSGLSARALSQTQIVLAWADPDTSVGFVIQRRDLATGVFSTIATEAAGTSFVDSGLLPNTFYVYQVAAQNSRGLSTFSTRAGAITLPAASVNTPVSLPGGFVLQVGVIRITADAVVPPLSIPDPSNISYTVSGNVSINGVLRLDGSATITVKPSATTMPLELDLGATISVSAQGTLYLDGVPCHESVKLWGGSASAGQTFSFGLKGSGLLTQLFQGAASLLNLGGVPISINTAGLIFDPGGSGSVQPLDKALGKLLSDVTNKVTSDVTAIVQADVGSALTSQSFLSSNIADKVASDLKAKVPGDVANVVVNDLSVDLGLGANLSNDLTNVISKDLSDDPTGNLSAALIGDIAAVIAKDIGANLANNMGLEIDGNLNFPNIPGIPGFSANFSKLCITRHRVCFAGSITLPNIGDCNAGFSVQNVTLTFDGSNFSGQGTLCTPGFSLTAAVQFLQGALQSIAAELSLNPKFSAGIPLGPVNVTGFDVKVGGLSQGPLSIGVGGDLTLINPVLSSIISLHHADVTWTYPASLAFTSDLNVLAQDVGQVGVSIPDPDMGTNGSGIPTSFQFTSHMSLIGAFDFFDGTFTISGGLDGSLQPFFNACAQASVQIPAISQDTINSFLPGWLQPLTGWRWPCFGFGCQGALILQPVYDSFANPIPIGSASVYASLNPLGFSADVEVPPAPNKLPGAGACIPFTNLCIPDRLGFSIAVQQGHVVFDGHNIFNFSKVRAAMPLTPEENQAMLRIIGRDQSSLGGSPLEGQGIYVPRRAPGGLVRFLGIPPVAQAIGTVTVAPGLSNITLRLFAMGGAPRYDLVEPNGTQVTPDSAATNGMTFVQNMNTEESFYVVNNPAAGDWKVIAEDSSFGPFVLNVFETVGPPVINDVEVTQPSPMSAAITYNVSDPSGQAKVSLFYDSQPTGFAGIPIVRDLPAAAGSYTWNTADGKTPPGRYYVFAWVEDGSHAPVAKYAAGTANVADPMAPAQPQAVTVQSGPCNSLLVAWAPNKETNLASYQVRYAVDQGDGTQLTETASAGSATSLRLRNLQENTAYRVAVVAYSQVQVPDPANASKTLTEFHRSLPSAVAVATSGAKVLPVVHLISPKGGEIIANDHSTTITWQLDNGDAVEDQEVDLSTDSGKTFTLLQAHLGPSARSFAWDVPASLRGTTLRVQVKALDCAGNQAAGASQADFTVADPTPGIARVGPEVLRVGQAATLAIEGADFAPGAVASFAGASLTTTYTNSSRLEAAVPATIVPAPGFATITVTNPDGLSAHAAIRIGNAGDLLGHGKVEIADVLMTLRFVVGQGDLTPQQVVLADVNGDGQINVLDVILMLRAALGLS